MEGISGITARIGTLESHLATLSPAGAARSTAAGSTAAASGATSAAGSSGPASSGPATQTAFADVLAQAVASQAPPATATTTTPGAPLDGPSALTSTTTTTTSMTAAGLATLLGTGAAGPGVSTATTTGLAPAAAVAAAAPPTAPTAAVSPAVSPLVSTELNSKGVPVDLARYGNGRVPEAALTPIGSGERLWAPAAAAFERMEAAAAADGVRFGVNDSYRSYADQVAMVERKGLHSQGGLAAQPGTSSHGWGMAVDLQLDSRAQSWMRENAGDFGFAETVSREPWHWAFSPTRAA